MPRNGSGQYDLVYNWNDDKTNGIKVLASRMQAQDQDIANALTGSLAKDGQTPLTGDLDFNSNKAINLADGTNAGDAVNVSQAQTGELEYYGVSTTTSGGTDGEDYSLAANATLLAYPTYTRFFFTCHFTCIDNPVARLDALADKTLVKSDGASGYTALEAGDMIADKEYIGIYNEDISTTNIIIENAENDNTSQSVQAGTSQAETITSGAFSVKKNYSTYTVDTEASTSEDDLNTISDGKNGQIIFLGITDNARIINIKNGTGNIINPVGLDITLSDTNDVACLKYNGSNWLVQYVNSATSEAIAYLGSTTISSVANIDITDLTEFSSYKLILQNVVPATNSVSLKLRVSTDNGSTFKAGASDYAWVANAHTTVPEDNVQGSSGTTSISLGNDGSGYQMNNNSNYGWSGEILLINPQNASGRFSCKYEGGNYLNSGSSAFTHVTGGGVYTQNTAINAIRFFFSSGNLSSGTIKLYGIK